MIENQSFSAGMTESERRFRTAPVQLDEEVGPSCEGKIHITEPDSSQTCDCAACRNRRAASRARDSHSPIRSVTDINQANRRAFGKG